MVKEACEFYFDSNLFKSKKSLELLIGVKDFTIGDLYNKYSNKLIYSTTNNEQKFYIYELGDSNNEIYNAFGLKFSIIKLGFLNGKLASIIFQLESLNDVNNSFHIVNDELIRLYGQPDFKEDNSKLESYWKGSKASLILMTNSNKNEMSLMVYNQ